MRPKYFFERFEAVQRVQIILRGRFVSHKVSNSFFEGFEVVQSVQIIFLVIPYDYFIHARTFFTIGIS